MEHGEIVKLKIEYRSFQNGIPTDITKCDCCSSELDLEYRDNAHVVLCTMCRESIANIMGKRFITGMKEAVK